MTRASNNLQGHSLAMETLVERIGACAWNYFIIFSCDEERGGNDL